MDREENQSAFPKLQISPLKVLYSLSGFYFFLLLMNFVSLGMKFTWGIERFQGAAKLFHFDLENNIPSFFSAVCLLTSGLLLFVISQFHKKRSEPFFAWLSLALIFGFLAVDEISMFHERLVEPMKKIGEISPYFNFAWIIPYGLATLLVAVVYLKFLLNLPKRTMVLFLVSGALYVSGALGFEMLGEIISSITEAVL